MESDVQPQPPKNISLAPDTVMALRFITERKSRRGRRPAPQPEQPSPKGTTIADGRLIEDGSC